MPGEDWTGHLQFDFLRVLGRRRARGREERKGGGGGVRWEGVERQDWAGKRLEGLEGYKRMGKKRRKRL